MSSSDDETGLAPTVLGQKVIETDAHLAWALDPDFGEAATAVTSPKVSAKSVVAAAVAGALLLIAGAGGVAVWHLRPAEPVAPVVVAVEPVAPAPASAAPAPSPPDVVIPPAFDVPDAREVTPNYDALFIAALKRDDWVVWDEAPIKKEGRMVCDRMRNGMSRAAAVDELATNSTFTPREAELFVKAAMATYPNCG